MFEVFINLIENYSIEKNILSFTLLTKVRDVQNAFIRKRVDLAQRENGNARTHY